MPKHWLGGADGSAPLQHKRRKVVHEAPTSEQVVSCHQLRRLLAFDQDVRRARHGLQSFKLLLDSIAAASEEESSQQVAILQQYLEANEPSSAQDDNGVALPDIMETWVFAAQIDDEALMSAVAVVLALVLRIASTSLRLVPHGLAICQALMQQRQLKCVAKNLSASKGKAFVISPTLRLLREVVSLDGGAYAKRVLGARDYTLVSLARNLELDHVSDGPQDGSRVSVRTNALLFVLSCFKFLHAQGRNEVLLQKDVVSHVTFMLKTDPPQLVIDVLHTLKTCVLMDSRIPRASKFKYFNTKTLARVLALYAYTSPKHTAEQVEAVREKAHEFLVYACTAPVAGILCPCKGLYPKAPADDDEGAGQGQEDLRGGISIYNFALSEFARKLRPWASLPHNRLLVAMFAAAPELVADYFFHNGSFGFEPKLSMTWVGYAAFLFDTMSLELPEAFGDGTRFCRAPPPSSILLDNILPPPLTHKVLVRCYTLSSQLTSLFATRILIVAVEKLAKACQMHQDGSSRRSSNVVKIIVGCYKSIPAESPLHRVLLSRLLRLYYELIVRVDEAQPANPDAAAWNVLELENIVVVASLSLAMKWFSRLDSLSLSPFVALLRLLCRAGEKVPQRQMLHELTVCLCICRCAAAPKKYLDQMHALAAQHGLPLACLVSLLFNACHAEHQDHSSLLALLHARIVHALPAITPLGHTPDLQALSTCPSPSLPDETNPSQHTTPTPTEPDDVFLSRLLAVQAPNYTDTSPLTKCPSRSIHDVHIRMEALVTLDKLALRHIIAFACLALKVVISPTHALYPKVNAFLVRSPSWALHKMPLAHHVLHLRPSRDGAHFAEVAHLLHLLLLGVRELADVLFLLRSRWLEKVLLLDCSVYLPADSRRRVLEIVYRAAAIPGGAAALVSRASILGWLAAARQDDVQEVRIRRALAAYIVAMCGEDFVEAWRRGDSSSYSHALTTTPSVSSHEQDKSLPN
ncbi:hypothetical protein CDD81_7313 [Ophiocordyceps australis]|uniref:Nucleolar pre-ribosomal-associated protein 1 C-terminal domain-containing protein n=1 Tax=Ophiocordyceps australis TaxID=1399860 RepID=A0A2C5Y3M5_9HYPO|nr:hypothetical protein CDD81_7313 [Ophiocordyceps australis]